MSLLDKLLKEVSDIDASEVTSTGSIAAPPMPFEKDVEETDEDQADVLETPVSEFDHSVSEDIEDQLFTDPECEDDEEAEEEEPQTLLDSEPVPPQSPEAEFDVTESIASILGEDANSLHKLQVKAKVVVNLVNESRTLVKRLSTALDELEQGLDTTHLKAEEEDEINSSLKGVEEANKQMYAVKTKLTEAGHALFKAIGY